jgi:hypothetical protein
MLSCVTIRTIRNLPVHRCSAHWFDVLVNKTQRVKKF